MQTKFITLALSALLALSSISVNALPAGAPEGSNAVQKSAGQDVAASKDATAASPSENKAGGPTDPVEGLIPEVGALLKTVGQLVEAVGAVLEGKPGNKNLDVNGILSAVLELLGLKQGEAAPGRPQPTGPAATPKDGNPLTIVVVFIDNIKGGHSGFDAANGNPSGLLTAVLALLGKVLGLVL